MLERDSIGLRVDPNFDGDRSRSTDRRRKCAYGHIHGERLTERVVRLEFDRQRYRVAARVGGAAGLPGEGKRSKRKETLGGACRKAVGASTGAWVAWVAGRRNRVVLKCAKVEGLGRSSNHDVHRVNCLSHDLCEGASIGFHENAPEVTI